jgi:hypothetical protein
MRQNCAWQAAIAQILVLLLLWSSGFLGTTARAGVSEYEVEAAFLAKFPDFVKWPASSGSPVIVGVLGDDPFGGTLDQMVKVKRSRRVEELKGCKIIFISRSERGNLEGILASLASANVLTVGDGDGFVRQGGVIEFVVEGGKVRFQINTGAAGRGGLQISSQLLKLAVRVVNF